jgi:nucleolar protein 53
VNVDKKSLKEKRDRLRKDRFKEKDRPKSKYEEVTIKKLKEKIARKKVLAKKKLLQKPKSNADEEEVFDVWG